MLLFKRILKVVGIFVVGIIVVLRFTTLCIIDKYTVPIMMYHSVNTVKHPESPTVTPDYFQYHMDFLEENGYDVISLEDLTAGVKGEKKLSRKSVVITFDDGFEDNYTSAFSVLKKYQFPATIFVPSGKIGEPGRLKWPQLREMIKNNIEIGSHGHKELYLPDLSHARQYEEIVKSENILEEKLGVQVKSLSYPIGGFSKDIKRMVIESGYKAACATNRGYDPRNKDVYELNRIRFGNADKSNMILRAKLSGYYNIFRKGKNPY